MHDKEFEEFEEFKNWIEGGGSNGKLLDYHTGVTRLIAYCEKLREIEIGWIMTLSSLEEENEKLKTRVNSYDQQLKVSEEMYVKIHKENKKLKAQQEKL